MNAAAANPPKRDDNIEATLRRAHARGARHMVLQGLALYYQSLVHRAVDDRPSYLDRVMRRVRKGRAPAATHDDMR